MRREPNYAIGFCFVALGGAMAAVVIGDWIVVAVCSASLIMFGTLAHMRTMEIRKAREEAHYARLKEESGGQH